MTKTQDRYTETVGRRKTAIARVRITPSTRQSVVVNDRDLAAYFPTKSHQNNVLAPFAVSGVEGKFQVSVLVRGGGVSAQSEAIRHGISRAITELHANARTPLKKEGFLKRDPRAKERRKFGLKKARKAAQWAKR